MVDVTPVEENLCQCIRECAKRNYEFIEEFEIADIA